MKPVIIEREEQSPGEFLWRFRLEGDPRIKFTAYTSTLMIQLKILLNELGHPVKIVECL